MNTPAKKDYELITNSNTDAVVRPLSSPITRRSRLIKIALVLAVMFLLAIIATFLSTADMDATYVGDWSVVMKFVPLVFGACMVMGILGLATFVTRNQKSLSFTDSGITIGQMFVDGQLATKAFKWGEISEMKLRPRISLSTEKKYVLDISAKGGRHSINLEDLLSCVHAGNFLNAARTWAPEAVAGLELPAHLTSQTSQSYTQLWLQYFSTPSKRQRLSDLTSGITLDRGKYKVVGRIGGGGQGTAYLALTDAEAEGTEEEVVLKEYVMPVHKGTVILEQTLEKLKKETRLLQALDHPNIVKCLGYFSEDYRGYVVLEYVDGRSLKDIVSSQGALLERQVIDIALQCCDILEYLHSCEPPVVHRDITPDNILMQDSGQLKLVDFNVAHQLETSATATVVGKHAYIPPEQFRGKPVPASDIYALGGTLFFILTAGDPEPITASHPREKNDAVTQALDEIVNKCTQSHLDRRYSQVSDLRRDLLKLKGKA